MIQNIYGAMPASVPRADLTAQVAQPETRNNNGVELVPAIDIPILPVLWLWRFWLARGKFHILAGPPATGKTTLAIAVAATLSNGGTWPDGSHAPMGSVVVWTCEDGIEDTIKPRLVAAGANEERILVLYGGVENGRRRQFDFERDMPGLEAAVKQRGDVVLIIIDSIAQAVPASNNNSRVRQALDPLVEFADRSNCAILGLTHVNKGSKKKHPLERINGSVAIGALSRVAWVAVRDENGGESGKPRSVLVRAKSNLGPVDGGFAYHVDAVDVPVWGGGVTHSSKVSWDEQLGGSPREIIEDAEGRSGGTSGREDRKQEAVNFLTTMLADEPRPTEMIEQAARSVGISWATVRRAAEELGVRKHRPMGSTAWAWELKNRTVVSSDAMTATESTTATPFQASSWTNRIHARARAGVAPYLPKTNEQLEQHEQVAEQCEEQCVQTESLQSDPVLVLLGHLIPKCVAAYKMLRCCESHEDTENEIDFRGLAIDDVLSEIEGLESEQLRRLRNALVDAFPWKTQ